MPDLNLRQVAGWTRRLARIAPGVSDLCGYRRADLPSDIIAGLSVAAVALPVGVAYAQLAGFPSEVGLYSSILPLVAYAIFGTSRQLIVGPDAATCAIIAAAVAPLAGGNESRYFSLSMALALMAGVFCIFASFLRLGALADFLSKPILVGFLNGMSLSIALGQMGKIFGFAITKQGVFPRLFEFVSKLSVTHWPTLIVGVAAFVVLILSPLVIRRLPAPLAAMIITGAAVKWLDLGSAGVRTIGTVPAGLPSLRVPSFPLDLFPSLSAEAAGLALVAFSSMMLTSRSFAAKNGYEVDVDREFVALGASNIAAALGQGFAVSGADSRTAVSDSSGGRTRVTGLITAAAIAAVLLFFTAPLRYVPDAALGVVLAGAAYSLFDFKSLKIFYQVDRRELLLSLVATVGVVGLGAIKGIFVAVVLALVRFVKLTSRPKVEILGSVAGLPGYHSIDRHPNASTIPGLLLFRFNGPIVFFNAPFFQSSILEAVGIAGPGLKAVVIDMIPITLVDLTGLQVVQRVIRMLQTRNIRFMTAGRQTEWAQWATIRGITFAHRSFPTLEKAIQQYEQIDRGLEAESGADTQLKLIHDATV